MVVHMECLYVQVLPGFHARVSPIQLLAEASGGRLKLHYDDVLTFDFEKACDQHVSRKTWEEGWLRGEEGKG